MKPIRILKMKHTDPHRYQLILLCFILQEQFYLEMELEKKNHYCIGIYLEKYVNSGNLEEEYTMLFDRMRSARNADQYSFQIAPSPEEIKSGIKSADDFINRMDQLLNETNPLE